MAKVFIVVTFLGVCLIASGAAPKRNWMAPAMYDKEGMQPAPVNWQRIFLGIAVIVGGFIAVVVFSN
jgi:hypothetical protein